MTTALESARGVHDGVHVGTPPQGDEEIGQIREGLQRMDPLLDVRWNARAFATRSPLLTAYGNATPERWEGRWQVIRFNTDRLHVERDFAVICTVTEVDRSAGYPIMLDRGPYAPLGFWLIDYMQLWDRAQGRLAEEMTKQVWEAHDRAGAITHDHAANQQALEQVYRDHGGLYWMGGAQGHAHPETARALWPTPATPSHP